MHALSSLSKRIANAVCSGKFLWTQESARTFVTGPRGKQSYQDKVTEPKLGFAKDTVNVLEQEACVTRSAFQGNHLDDRQCSGQIEV